MSLIESFEANRPLLISIASQMLGSAADAEDMVQEAYLRARGAPAQEIATPRAYLRTIVKRLCLDVLTSARVAREQPLSTEPQLPALVEQDDLPLQVALQREAVSRALLILLERLTPQERVVFLLREVFAYSYAEIAALVGLRPAYCRQLFHRAQGYLEDSNARFRPSPGEHRRLTEQFLAAAQEGQLPALTTLLLEPRTRVD